MMHLVQGWWRHLTYVVTVAVVDPNIHYWWIVVVGFPEIKEIMTLVPNLKILK